MIDYILWYSDVATIADGSNYRSEVEPLFRSTPSSCFVTLYNLNYNVPVDNINILREESLHDKKQALGEQKTGLHEMLFPNDFIDNLNVSTPTKENMKKIFSHFGYDTMFTRADVMMVTGLTATPASELMRKMRNNGLIISVMG